MITEPTINERGDEEHPSFGVARLHQVTSHPAARLFDSSIGHSRYITMEVSRATRRRELHRDWIHGGVETLIEIGMSMSQWGELVSSANAGSGVPVTIRRVGREAMPQAAHESRLALTAQAAADAAAQGTADVKLAVDALVAGFQERAGRRDMAKLISTLQSVVHNLPANIKFAADMLTEHAEEVVSKARADLNAAAAPERHRPVFGLPYPSADEYPPAEIEGT